MNHRNDIITEAAGEDVSNLRIAAVSIVATLLGGPSLERSEAIADRMIAAAQADLAARQGNRDGRTWMTYDDLRVVLADTLEICARELRAHDPK